MWDLAIFQVVPGIRMAAPRDAKRLAELLREAVAVEDAPTMIRFGKGSATSELSQIHRTSDGVDVLFKNGKPDVLLIGVGAMAETALEVASRLEAHGIGATVIDPRWVVPVQPSVLAFAGEHRLVVTIEDGVKVGGVGTRIRQDLRDAQIDTALTELGLPDEFLEHASRGELMLNAGLDVDSIVARVVAQVNGELVPHARPQS
jgi:1-deoxy-D-xylulose-5-phosphate synthase